MMTALRSGMAVETEKLTGIDDMVGLVGISLSPREQFAISQLTADPRILERVFSEGLLLGFSAAQIFFP